MTLRIEQDDPSITYSGNWYSNGAAANSSGGAALSNIRGSRATVTFNGTGITWIGVADRYSGFANVYVDGVHYRVTTYDYFTLYQKVLFTISGLAAGPHTLSIEVLHERDYGSEGSWVWIDAFDIENGFAVPGGVKAAAGRVEENSPSVSYFGNWYSNVNIVHSGGSAVLAADAGSHVTVDFVGTGIAWIAYRDSWSGVANIYLDGALYAIIDTYLSPGQA
jgi:hypothetical protein